MIKAAIHSILTGSASVNAAVSGRVFPIIIPQWATYPSIRIYSSVSPTNEKDGVSQLDIYSLQVDVYAETLTEVDNISDDIRTAMDRAITGVYDGVNIDSLVFDGWSDSYEEEPKMYRKMTDYTVRIKR